MPAVPQGILVAQEACAGAACRALARGGLAMGVKIDIDRDKIVDFCRRHHITKLSLFGSVLREDFAPESDVDVLVEFRPGHGPGFLRLCGMERELSSLLGKRRADIVTPKFLNRRLRDRVLAAAEVQYAEG